MRFFKLMAVLLCMALALCGCSAEGGGRWNDGSALLHAPQPQQPQQQLLDAVYTYLGRNITLKYPLGGQTSTPFFWWDADGDGADELLVLYQNTAKSKNVQLALLRPAMDGGWYAVHMDVEGVAGDVAQLQALQLAGGQNCLMAAYQDATGRDWTLCFYRWENGALHESQRLVCQQYVVQDLNDDGYQQIAVIQQNDIHKLLQVRVYGGPKAQPEPFRTPQEPLPLLVEQSVTTLDPRFERCTFMAYSCPGEEQTLVMDFADGEGGRLGEVVIYRQDRFLRCYTPDDLSIPNFTARAFDELEPMDVNGDGTVEQPRVERRVVAENGADRFYFVSWYTVGSKACTLQGCGITDVTTGCFIGLPQSWHGQVMLQSAGGSVWSLRDMESSGEKLSFQAVVTGGAPAGYQLLGDLGRQQMFVLFADDVTQEEKTAVLEGFRPLYQ